MLEIEMDGKLFCPPIKIFDFQLLSHSALDKLETSKKNYEEEQKEHGRETPHPPHMPE